MTESASSEMQAAAKTKILFYDSVTPAEIPDSATYAALYADGEFEADPDHVKRFTHRRWITCTGRAHHVGIADFEYPNEVFTEETFLSQWAVMRNAKYGVPGIVYTDMSDAHRAIARLRDVPVLWWIATRQRGKLSPAVLADILRTQFHADIRPEDIWGHQYEDVNGKYDVSQLFGSWYH